MRLDTALHLGRKSKSINFPFNDDTCNLTSTSKRSQIDYLCFALINCLRPCNNFTTVTILLNIPPY